MTSSKRNSLAPRPDTTERGVKTPVRKAVREHHDAANTQAIAGICTRRSSSVSGSRTNELCAQLRVTARWGMLSLLLGGCGGWQLEGSKTPDDARGTNPRPRPEQGVEPVATNESGAHFLLNGEPFCFHGSNNYYLTFKSPEMIRSVYENSQKIGLKVFRHWAFTDRGSLDGSVPSVDGDGTKEGVYFQYFDTKTGRPAYNEGPDGLQRLDYMVAEARKYDLRLVLVLVNNWYHFGGMDQYLEWFGLDEHPAFYTDDRVKKAYKDWVAYLLNRTNSVTGVPYKDDPHIFAWELANEPRRRNYTKYDSDAGWDNSTITDWATEMAAFVRSIDPLHMIAVGDEGFFSRDSTDEMYNGADGVDHDALLRIEDIDYGTYHLYPDHWNKSVSWGERWIVDHIEAARRAGKPTVLEEYGLVVTRDEKTDEISSGGERRHRGYQSWNDLVQLGGGAGSMYWMQAGYDDFAKKNYQDYDHFTVYSPDSDPTAKLLQSYARDFNQTARLCQLARAHRLPAKREVPQDFVTVSVAP